MARPKLNINAEEVRKLAELGCKLDEMAAFFNCDRNTLANRFSAEISKGKANLKLSLRRWQIQAAQKGNVVMMIWLGKQMLDQVERTQIDITKIDNETFMKEAQRRLADASDAEDIITKITSES